jgi:hypothetical protein
MYRVARTARTAVGRATIRLAIRSAVLAGAITMSLAAADQGRIPHPASQLTRQVVADPAHHDDTNWG